MPDTAHDFAKPRPGDSFGPYRLVRELGSGSSGIVYLAELLATGNSPQRQVALKILRPQRVAAPQSAERFWRTAALAERAAGPNICPLEGHGTHDGLPYLALRYLEGRTLADWIAERRQHRATNPGRDHADLLRQFEKLARALHHLHTHRVTHRDLKPSNILIDTDGEPWLLDFGLMVAADADETVKLAGSPAYLAPELLRGDGTPGVASDIYALGVTLFEAATGHVPHHGHTAADLLAEVMASPRPTAHEFDRSLPTDLDIVLDRLLQMSPEDRYQSGAEVADDLRRVRERLPLTPRRTPRMVRLRRWLRRNPVPAATMIALVITTAGLAWLLSGYRRALHLADLLASSSMLAAAERTAESLLPARIETLPSVRAWLAVHDGPQGLEANLRNLRTALAELQGSDPLVGLATAAATRAELEVELRAVEQIPRLAAALQNISPSSAAIPALLPAVDRHRQTLEARIDEPPKARADTAAEDETGRLARQLRMLADELVAATGPEGVLVRMRRELAALEMAAASLASDKPVWDRTCTEIANSPAYAADTAAGFRMRPLEGLLPIGADPASGLQEFALLRSGDAPRRAADGRFTPKAQDAIVFVLLPGGTYTMGAVANHEARNCDWLSRPDEGPETQVTLSPFLLAKYELTQAQWQRLGGEPSAILRSGDRVGDVTVSEVNPAEGMSFAMAELVLRRNGLGLPTEAQWEFAARRSGLQAPFGNKANLQPDEDGYPSSHAPIGTYPADRSGMHDLHGNVSEMVTDTFGNYDLFPPRAVDGLRLGWRFDRIARGGGFWSEPREARATSRVSLPDFGLLPFVGARPTRSLDLP